MNMHIFSKESCIKSTVCICLNHHKGLFESTTPGSWKVESSHYEINGHDRARLQWMMSLMNTNRVKKLFKHFEVDFQDF